MRRATFALLLFLCLPAASFGQKTAFLIEKGDRIAGTQPRIEAVVVGGQEQIAGGSRKKRRSDGHRVESHRCDPIEMVGPHVDRSGEQRMQVIEGRSRHG